MIKKNYSIKALLFIGFSVVIIAFIIDTLYIYNQYDALNQSLRNNFNNLSTITDIRENADSMYNAMSSLSTAEENQRQNYRDQYESLLRDVQDKLDDLKSSRRDTTLYYHAQDLGNMFKTYDEGYRSLIEMESEGRDRLYLKDIILSQYKMRSYIKNELDDTSAYLTKIGQDQFTQYNVQRKIAFVRFIIISLIIILSSIVVAFLVFNSISKPLQDLAARMSYFMKTGENRKPGKSSLRCTEMAELSDNYDRMIQKIIERNELEHQLSRQKLDNLETQNLLHASELSRLQMQVNPHFLFNTLNSISALTQIEDSPKAAAMVEHLSSMLRYSMTSLDKLKPLREELEIVNHYVYIQNQRFGSRIRYEQRVDASALECSVPCMIIQPLIENAYVHGFENSRTGGLISLIITKDADAVSIVVSDDGDGIGEERLKQIRSSGNSTDPAPHIGLSNVMRRIFLLYGNGHFFLDSGIGVGTRVTLIIPSGSVSTDASVQGKESGLFSIQKG